MQKYVVISIPDNVSGNWQGNHIIIKDNLSLDEVKGYLEDELAADNNARHLGFNKASTNTLSYMTMEEYEKENQEHNAFTYGGNGDY